MIFDTETTSLDKPFVYNIGYTIINTEDGSSVLSRDYVVEQVWHNLPLFESAYYANKRQLYVRRMKSRTVLMEKFGYITQQIIRDIKSFEVVAAFAYNSGFDERVFEFNCEWFKCINPFETIPVYDIRGHVSEAIANTREFTDFCEEHKRFTESGNYSTTAETVYQFLTGNTDFQEEHTALADSIIETEILKYCCAEKGLEWTTAYTVKKIIPRVTLKTFELRTEQGIFTFPYTSKTKLRGKDGYTLKNKLEEKEKEK